MKSNLGIVYLVSAALAGATFMVVESAGYYSMLYKDDQIHIAWAAAVLSEIFQHTLIIMPCSSNLQSRIFKGLALLIFLLTITAAGYKVYKPVRISLELAARNSKLIRVLEQEIVDNKTDQQSFTTEKNLQKTNAARAVNARRESSAELKNLLKTPAKHKNNSMSTFEIVHLFLLRVAIQTAALACAWKLGTILQEKRKKVPPPTREIVKRWKVKHLRSEKGFVGVVQFNDGRFMAISPNRRKPYKTWNGAVQFFKGTKYEGRIPLEPTTTIPN